MASYLPDTIPADFMAALTHLDSKDKLGVEEMKLRVLLETSGEPLRQNGREESRHGECVTRVAEILELDSK